MTGDNGIWEGSGGFSSNDYKRSKFQEVREGKFFQKRYLYKVVVFLQIVNFKRVEDEISLGYYDFLIFFIVFSVW